MIPDPIVFAFASALLFGTSILAAKQGLAFHDAQAGSLLSIASTCVLYWALAPLLVESGDWGSPAVLWFAAIGLFHPFLSLLFSFQGTAHLGPTISATLASTAPLFATASAMLVLGEQPGRLVLGGTAAVVAGLMLLSWRGRARRDWALWALAFPLGAAFIRGTIQIGFKHSLSLLPAPFFAALVSYSVSFAVALLAYQHGTRPRLLRRAAWRGLPWYAATGVLNGVSIICMYTALNHGRVVVVAPIVGTYPLFTLLISLLLRLERITLQVAVAVAMVVAGVALISLS